ncbi:MAG: Ig domain-containing protein, partial [Pseudomonadota bacterium]|nr:Ig domain-containing protein [Pseudomonadota bacterium]
QVYAYDVTATDAEGDAVSYSLNTAPTGMTMSAAGEIRWIPESAGTYSVVVNATDGSDAGTQSFDITVNAEPAVAGRAVKGVLANAPVEAAVYAGLDAEGEHSWNVIGTTTTDANGYFGFSLGTQSAPVRVRVTTDAETTMVCDTPSGCLISPPAVFGESGTPAAGMVLDTIVSGADFAGPLAVTPMTHMAATWLQAFPQALDDNNVLLAHKRLAALFGFTDDTYVSQRVPDLTDAFERNFALSSNEQALRHSIFSASLQETAIVASLPIDSVTENIGLIFGLLGGQMPLKSGELDVSTLGLTDPDTEEPITTVSYTGFDTFVASAETVGQFINDGSLDSMIAGFGNLVTDWTPELADPSICLVADNPDLDRTECRNITTIGEATGYDAANFARALAPIDVAGGYLDDAQAAELANGSTVNRDLGWLYVDETAQNETAEMLGGFTEVLGYGLKTALCVPQKNNIPYTCTMEKSAGFESLNVSLSNCEGYSGDDSCDLRVTGSANGQTFNVSSRIEDIREMLGGKRRVLFSNYDFDAGPLPMCFTGTISNSVATMNLNNFCLVLNVSDSRSDLLAPFEDLNAVAYIDIGNEGSAAYNAMQDLLAEVVLEIAATGGLSLASTDSNIGTYSMSNIDMSFVFDRESLVNLNKGTPVFDFEVASFSRTNPWGETLNSVSGYPMFKLQVDDTTILTGRNVKDNVGVPPTLSVTNAIVEGLGPVVDIAKEYALSMIDTTVAAPELMPEEWDAIIAEVEANLAYNGTINTTIQDPSVGDRTYIATLTPEGNVFISQENSTANAMQLYLSGATGYIYADETLVATAHLGNSQDGMLLSFVDGTQRSYTNANPNLSGQLDSFLEFLQVLVPPAEETAP